MEEHILIVMAVAVTELGELHFYQAVKGEHLLMMTLLLAALVAAVVEPSVVEVAVATPAVVVALGQDITLRIGDTVPEVVGLTIQDRTRALQVEGKKVTGLCLSLLPTDFNTALREYLSKIVFKVLGVCYTITDWRA